MLRIVTYNIHFGKRLKKILAWLATQKKTDIFCFQEFPKRHIADCMAALSKNIYRYRFAPSLRRRNTIYGELTIFRTDRMRLASFSSLSLHTNTLDRLSMGRSSRRSCLLTTFLVQRKKFIVTNVQLACLASNALRYKQLTHIIQALKTKSAPHIIVGDFNMSSFLGRKKLFLLMKNNFYKTLETYIATHRLMIVRHQLDYIFARKCVIRRVDVERVRFSDHYPVTALVRLLH